MVVHLHAHSYFSFHAGCLSVRDLVAIAAERHTAALALTDRNGMYGAMEFLEAAEAAGVKPILGVELDEPGDPAMRGVVLAKNREGYARCCELTTARHRDPGFDLVSSLAGCDDSVILLVNHPTLLRRLVRRRSRQAPLVGELIFSAARHSQTVTTRALCLAEKVPMVVTSDVYFRDADDFVNHHILRAMGERSTISRLDTAQLDVSSEHYLQSGDTLMAPAALDEAPKLWATMLDIVEQCNLEFPRKQWFFPEKIFGDSDTAVLYDEARRGMEKRYHHQPDDDTRARLQYELKVIQDQGYVGYFLAVFDIVHYAKLRGIDHIGRGSAANSLVAYSLGITDVDPMKHDLFFERFINPERTSPPDIDVDFPWDQRDLMLDYVFKRFGEDRTVMVNELPRLRGRGCFRHTAMAMGIPEDEVSLWVKRLLRPSRRRKLHDAEEAEDADEEIQAILEKSQTFFGTPTHISLHPGGVVIAPRPITWYMPYQTAPNGRAVSQFDMDSMELVGGVKIDVLSLRGLGSHRECLEILAKRDGEAPQIEDFDMVCADPKVKDLLRSADVMGCFYIESPAMKSVLTKMAIETWEDLTIASSIIRPGVSQSGMMREYLTRLRASRTGDREVLGDIHPRMRELMPDTFGVMIYQEDVLKVASHIAGMSLAKGDLMRRAMSGKSRSKDAMLALEREFVDGCHTHSHFPNEDADELWRQVSSFAGYSFCKSHSASFAILSMKCAYLRAYFPAEFMTAVLNNQGGYYNATAYTQEVKRLGFPLRPPDVNASDWAYTTDGREVRVGFLAVKGLDRFRLGQMIDERHRHGSYDTLAALIRRSGLGPETIGRLIDVGACDSLGPNRSQLHWLLNFHVKRQDAARGWFDDQEEHDFLRRIAHLPDWTEATKAAMEMHLMGFMVAHHPLDFIKDKVKALHEERPFVRSTELEKLPSHKPVRLLGWQIAFKPIHMSGDRPMSFMSLEDYYGRFEATVFPEAHDRLNRLVYRPGPFVVDGKVDRDFDMATVVVDDLKLIELDLPSGVEAPRAAVQDDMVSLPKM